MKLYIQDTISVQAIRMTDLSYYTNCGKPWTYDEDMQLRNEYNIEKKTISEIAIIHKRRPGGIAVRCKTLFNLANREEVRGYNEYKNSDLYKNICELNKTNRTKNTHLAKKTPIIQPISESVQQLETTLIISDKATDIIKIKQDIVEIKEQLGQILHYIKLMYDFESLEIT